MFTGIIQAVAEVKEARVRNGVRWMRIALPPRWKLRDGQSVSVNGICTTVIGSAARSFDVEYMPETLRKTTAGSWGKGTRLNLERSLAFGDPVDGQLLPGHVDGRARITRIIKDGASRLITVSLPKLVAPHVRLHGWIALDGVSLTVARRAQGTATVALVPYTLSATTLGLREEGDFANIEADRSLGAARAARAKVSKHASRTGTRRR